MVIWLLPQHTAAQPYNYKSCLSLTHTLSHSFSLLSNKKKYLNVCTRIWVQVFLSKLLSGNQICLKCNVISGNTWKTNRVCVCTHMYTEEHVKAHLSTLQCAFHMFLFHFSFSFGMNAKASTISLSHSAHSKNETMHKYWHLWPLVYNIMQSKQPCTKIDLLWETLHRSLTHIRTYSTSHHVSTQAVNCIWVYG